MKENYTNAGRLKKKKRDVISAKKSGAKFEEIEQHDSIDYIRFQDSTDKFWYSDPNIRSIILECTSCGHRYRYCFLLDKIPNMG